MAAHSKGKARSRTSGPQEDLPDTVDEAECQAVLVPTTTNFRESAEDSRRHWGGGIMGSKSNDIMPRETSTWTSCLSVFVLNG